MEPTTITPAHMTQEQAAEYLGVKSETLNTWRCKRQHAIPYYKVGRLIRYRKADLDAWLEQRRVAA